MVDFLAWLEVNKKKLLGGAIIAGLLASAYSIYRWHENEAEAQASEALFKLQKPGARQDSESAPTAREYLQVAAAHAGTDAAARAVLFGAEALFREGKYAEARTEFERYVSNHSDSPDVATATFGAAACLDALDKTNEALTAYQDVAARYANSSVAAQAKLAVARLNEARNEPTQALRIYDELLRPTAQTAWSSEAGMRRELLLRKHPELMRTNAIVAATPLPVLSGATNPLTLGNSPATSAPSPVKKP